MTNKKRFFFQIIIAIMVVALGFGGMKKLIAEKPVIKKRRPSIQVPTATTYTAKRDAIQMIIHGEGTARPLKKINLVPQVSGKAVYVSPSLVNGGEFKKDELLIKIDPSDYELAVTSAEAFVKENESRLRQAEEESAAALEEWRMHNTDNQQQVPPPPLVAKEPQLKAAQARFEGGKADLLKARLNLARTEITAPFNGRVSEKNVDTGQYVSSAQSLATIYSTDVSEITVPLEEDALAWINVPGFTEGAGPGSLAIIKASIAGIEKSWKGRIHRTSGKLDERTRMIDVVIRVDRPYAELPPLAPGLFVTADIMGKTLQDITSIPRSALKGKDIVWVVDDKGIMHFRRVVTAWSTEKTAIITSGLNDGEMVVTSLLKEFTDGMYVKTTDTTGVK